MRRLLVVLTLGVLLWLLWVRETRFPLRPQDAPAVALLVAQGDSVQSIAERLGGLGLLPRPFLFRTFVYLHGEAARLRAGEYSLEGPLSLADIADILVRGEVVRRDVTFPEGKNLDEMTAIVGEHGLDAKVFEAATRDPVLVKDMDANASSLEGYLFPDTYDVPKTPETAVETRRLVARMVERFRSVVGPERRRLQERGLTIRQVVILASLVELETAQPTERPRIAAVFFNRLRLGMPLQTDPTVIYALRKAGLYEGTLRKKDLGIDSPYNTYRHPGLPPGPIASAGRDSLLAVLEPADVKDLYFVSRNDGTHEFSETLAQHERAVDRYQRHREAPKAASRG